MTDNNAHKTFIVILCMYIIDGDFFTIKTNNRENSMIKLDSTDSLTSRYTL